MCGLLTFVSADGTASSRKKAIGAALETIHHRGPDETGVELVEDDVVLGFKRLSIIDVAHSHQPLWYLDRYVITFNGEIYNYLELRDELSRDYGAKFETDGDTEVIVAAYHYWGIAGIRRLRGMFAFVIWDAEERRAVGARDPFGIKPLHYLSNPEGIYFASEKKALLPFATAAHSGDAGIDPISLSQYLTMQYVPEPGTLHKGIGRLGSGESFTYIPGQTITVQRYFKPLFRPTPINDSNELYRRIQETLRDSVRIHMRSDVPVGAFLSSGIDSTAIVALAREINPNILTFTAALDVPGYSELDIAQESARALDVTTYPVVVNAQMMMQALPRIIWHLDDPVADPSLVPLYYVARKASELVTVVLSGEGADEFFAGYPLYREPLSLRRLASLPSSLQRGLRALAAVIPEGVRGKSFLERGTVPIQKRYDGGARIFSAQEKQRLLRHHDLAADHLDVTSAIYADCTDVDDVAKMQYVDLHTWLRGDILVKADRMSMAHSLELRVPFLDYEVFDVASQIPLDLKLPPGSDETKYALRRALEGIVPPNIVNRVKLGFPTPIRVWLKDEMYEWARRIFATSGAGNLLDLTYAQELLDTHQRGNADNSRKIWTVLVFCLWYALFVDGSLDPGVPRAESQLLTKPIVAG